MTGEQKPGGLEVVAWLYSTVSGEGKALVRPLQYLNGEEVLGVALTPAEPAEARIRELEADLTKVIAERDRNWDEYLAERQSRLEHGAREAGYLDAIPKLEARATAAGTKLAKATEALEKTRDHFDFLVRMASGSAVFEIVDGKRVRRKLGEAMASEADEGSKFVRQTLAALQEAEGKA